MLLTLTQGLLEGKKNKLRRYISENEESKVWELAEINEQWLTRTSLEWVFKI